MPTYVYRCPSCVVEKELIQKISERENPLCDNPLCGHSVMESVIGKTNFVLKGRGWAKDGYGK